MKRVPIVTTVQSSQLQSHTFRSDNGVEAPWSPKLISTPTYNPVYASLEEPDVASDGKRPRGTRGYHPVNHYKRFQVPLYPYFYTGRSDSGVGNGSYWVWGPTPSDYYWKDSDYGQNSNGYYHFGPLELPLNGLPQLFDIPTQQPLQKSLPEGIDYLCARAIQGMSPGIKANVSAINSLLELKDFSRLPSLVGQVSSTLRSLPNLWSQSSRTLSNLAKSAAELHLTNQFALKPLLSDIAGIQKALVGSRKQLKQLLEGANRPHRSHFMIPLSSEYKDIYDAHPYTEMPSWSLVPTSLTSTRTVKYPVRQFNATMEYNYSIPAALQVNNDLLALLDSLGVNLNPAIIWNAIPWSFVVDWVISVGRFLDQFKRRNIEPVLNITRFCYSVKLKRLTTVSLVHDGAQFPLFAVTEESYRRFVRDPSNVYSLLKVGGLSLNELGLTSALLASRLRGL